MRHAPLAIGQAEQDAWLRHMTAAVAGSGLHAVDEADVLQYFASTAAMLRNEAGPEAAGTPGTPRRIPLKLVPPG